MSSDPKNYFGLLVDGISVPGLTIKWLDTSARKLNTKYSHYEFQLKTSLNLLKVLDVSFEMSCYPKNYFGFT